jgi:hypothetical protein
MPVIASAAMNPCFPAEAAASETLPCAIAFGAFC